MILNNSLKTLFVFAVLLNLCACSGLGTRKESTEDTAPDLLEVQKRADEAYLNDDMAASERDYLVLVRELPEIPLHWFRLGNIYVRTNRPAAAINLYREAVLRDPKFAKAWFNLSIVQLKQSAYSLNEMLIYVDKNDPMYVRANKLLEGIETIIKQN